MKKIKVGIIGVGFIGQAHIEAVRRLGYADIVAICDTENAKEKAAQFDIPSFYENYKDLLRRDDIEVVHICTPNYMHYPIAMAAIEAGKHIICEKPLAMDEKQSDKLLSAAEKKGIVHAVDFNYRGYPLVQQMKSMISAGFLGEIYLIHGSYLQDWLLFPTDYNWRIDPKLGGELRAIGDIGSHWCDLVQYITGARIVSVFADLRTVIKERIKPEKKIAEAQETFKASNLKQLKGRSIKVKTEDYGAVLLRFSNGASGVFLVSQVSAGRKNRLFCEIDGSKGALAWDQENPNELWIGKREESIGILPKDPGLLDKKAKLYAHYPGGHPEGYPDALKNLFSQVYSDIIENTRKKFDYPTFADGHWAMVVNSAILKSYKAGQWVKVKP